MRIFVGYGQGGVFTSPAMLALARKLGKYGEVSTHDWYNFALESTRYINLHPTTPVACVGYSLSAGQLTYISSNAHRRPELGIAIDPSRMGGYVTFDRHLQEYVQAAPRFKRLICFYNQGAWPFGGALYVGGNVEVRPLNTFHLAAQADAGVWATTERAIQGLK